MKKLLLSIFTLLGTNCLFSQNIYVTDIPSISEVKVYVTSITDLADLIVYKAPMPSFWGLDQNTGIWYFVSVPELANKIINYVQIPDLADLTVYFTDFPDLAGWQNSQKKYLLAPKN